MQPTKKGFDISLQTLFARLCRDRPLIVLFNDLIQCNTPDYQLSESIEPRFTINYPI